MLDFFGALYADTRPKFAEYLGYEDPARERLNTARDAFFSGYDERVGQAPLGEGGAPDYSQLGNLDRWLANNPGQQDLFRQGLITPNDVFQRAGAVADDEVGREFSAAQAELERDAQMARQRVASGPGYMNAQTNRDRLQMEQAEAARAAAEAANRPVTANDAAVAAGLPKAPTGYSYATRPNGGLGLAAIPGSEAHQKAFDEVDNASQLNRVVNELTSGFNTDWRGAGAAKRDSLVSQSLALLNKGFKLGSLDEGVLEVFHPVVGILKDPLSSEAAKRSAAQQLNELVEDQQSNLKARYELNPELFQRFNELQGWTAARAAREGYTREDAGGGGGSGGGSGGGTRTGPARQSGGGGGRGRGGFGGQSEPVPDGRGIELEPLRLGG